MALRVYWMMRLRYSLPPLLDLGQCSDRGGGVGGLTMNLQEGVCANTQLQKSQTGGNALFAYKPDLGKTDMI